MEPKIELAKPRDFGEIISDTFSFIRQNFKEILKSFFIFCGFFMLASIATGITQQLKLQRLFAGINGNTAPTFAENYFSGFLLSYGITMLVMLAMYTSSTVTILGFMTLYKQKGNIAPTTEELWEYFKYYFFRTLLGVFVVGILLAIGFMVCLIPGIWLYPILGLIFPIMIMENASFGYAFSRSFNLIKDNWWVTAGTILVIWIIAYFMITFIMLPASAVNVVEVFLRKQKIPTMSTGTVILSVVLQQLAQLILIIPIVGLGLCYYNLVESKDGTSLLDRINKFGDPNQPTNLPTEEY